MFVLPLSRSVSRTPSGSVVSPQFSRALDRFFDDSVERTIAGNGARTPALDVSETDTAYAVVFDVPGVTREQLKVTVEGRRVVLETIDAAPDAAPADAADAPKPAAAGGATTATAGAAAAATRVLYRERSVPRYARTVSLPAEVDQAASQARFENGVLTLTLAKKVAGGATRLSIA